MSSKMTARSNRAFLHLGALDPPWKGIFMFTVDTSLHNIARQSRRHQYLPYFLRHINQAIGLLQEGLDTPPHNFRRLPADAVTTG